MLACVIADDLSGANGLAGDFARYGLVSGVLCGGSEIPRTSPWDVLVVDTDSRNLDPARSAIANARSARCVAALGPRIIVKKIDSLLRGPIGSDVASIMAAIGEKRVAVVAAVPHEGRKTIEGIQWLGDAPLREGEAGRPLRVTDCFGATGITVHSIGLGTVNRGATAVEEMIRAKGDGIFVCDAANDIHLDDVLSGALAAGIRFVASSYGVAHSLLKACALDAGPVLAICGSVSDAAATQVAYATAHGHTSAVRWRVGCESECRAAVIDSLRSGRDVLLHTGGSTASRRPQIDLEPALAEFLVTIVQELPKNVSAFVATGGATAECVRRALRAQRIAMLGPEVLPCAPIALFEGGPFDGTVFITKPGAFGAPSSLVDLIDGAKIASLSRRARRESVDATMAIPAGV
jgi:uncharacterized protein YgbK (DUF1537 family)